MKFTEYLDDYLKESDEVLKITNYLKKNKVKKIDDKVLTDFSNKLNIDSSYVFDNWDKLEKVFDNLGVSIES